MITVLQQRIMKYGMREILKAKKRNGRDQDLNVYYFGYGANLTIDRFHKWFIPAKVIGPAFINDYQLKFNLPCEYLDKGFAGIEPLKGATVWGTLFKVNSKALRMLDILEWVPFHFYKREQVVAVNEGRKYSDVFSYITLHSKKDLIPSSSYLDFIIDSGIKAGFPKDYISSISNHPSRTNFKLDTSFSLRNPSKKRVFHKYFKKLYLKHDQLREGLTKLIP